MTLRKGCTADAETAAVTTCRRAGFAFVGECRAFGNDYFAAEYITGKGK